MKLFVLASGSKGNCTIVKADDHYLMIDLGISHKRLTEEMTKIGITLDNIEGFLFTHNHNDHIGGVDKYIDLNKCYTGKGTLDVPESNLFEPLKTVKIGAFEITPLPTSHDAPNPFGFVIEYNGEKLSYITDTGMIRKGCLSYITNCEHYVMESNYDYDMLIASGRPAQLIRRIYSNEGHLSNIDSAGYVTHLIGNKTKDIVLAHISEECNSPEVALKTYHDVFDEEGLDFNSYNIICAKQWEAIVVGE